MILRAVIICASRSALANRAKVSVAFGERSEVRARAHYGPKCISIREATVAGGRCVYLDLRRVLLMLCMMDSYKNLLVSLSLSLSFANWLCRGLGVRLNLYQLLLQCI